MSLEKRLLLTIRLHLPEKLQDDERVVIPCIKAISGLWKITTPLQADEAVDHDDHFWQASVHVPKNTEFEFRWAIYKENHLTDIEKEFRCCKVGRFGGVIHTSWNSEVKILEPDMCVVTFYTRYRTLPDERLAILGSTDSLGNWKSSKAAFAYEYPSGSGEWSASIAMEKDSFQEWKWVVLDLNNDFIRRWEDRQNRQLDCNSVSWKTVWAPWNGRTHCTGQGVWENVEWSALRLKADILDDSMENTCSS